MLNYILRRLLLMIPTLIGITLMLFLMARFAPGLTGGQAFSESDVQNSRQDREIAEKLLLKRLDMLDANGNQIPIYKQYFHWLGSACRLEFGTSVKYNVPVSELIKSRLPVTALINFIEIVIVYTLAIPGGMLAAVKRGKWFDHAWGVVTIALFSLPVIWTGSFAIAFFANPRHLDWFPASGIHAIDPSHLTTFQYVTDYLWHLVLPVTVMSLGGFAFLTKLMRASLIDNLHLDYARTARAKGVSPFRVVIHHVFRNSLLPLITVAAGIIPSLLGGSVIIEKIFSIPGMGQLAFTATFSRDLPVLQAVTFIGAVISLVFVLIRDICYALIDPRVSYD